MSVTQRVSISSRTTMRASLGHAQLVLVNSSARLVLANSRHHVRHAVSCHAAVPAGSRSLRVAWRGLATQCWRRALGLQSHSSRACWYARSDAVRWHTRAQVPPPQVGGVPSTPGTPTPLPHAGRAHPLLPHPTPLALPPRARARSCRACGDAPPGYRTYCCCRTAP